MTKEEAIKRVKGYLTDCLPDDCYEEVEEIIEALAQPEPEERTAESAQNVPEDDLISRKAAIDALMEWVEKEENKSWSTFKGLFHWTGIKAMLECLPSAQPEINCSEIPNNSDLISRQAAKLKVARVVWEDGDSCYDFIDKCVDSLDDVPSAQPETAKRIVGQSRGGMTLWYQCDMCNEPVDVQDNYCRGCGRRLTDG